jgi:hypothetical protein
MVGQARDLQMTAGLIDWEYAPSLAVCQRECRTYVRIHRYVARRGRQVA